MAKWLRRLSSKQEIPCSIHGIGLDFFLFFSGPWYGAHLNVLLRVLSDQVAMFKEFKIRKYVQVVQVT